MPPSKDQRESLDGKVLALICENHELGAPVRLSLQRLSERFKHSTAHEVHCSLQRLRRRGAITFYTREGWVPRG